MPSCSSLPPNKAQNENSTDTESATVQTVHAIGVGESHSPTMIKQLEMLPQNDAWMDKVAENQIHNNTNGNGKNISGLAKTKEVDEELVRLKFIVKLKLRLRMD